MRRSTFFWLCVLSCCCRAALAIDLAHLERGTPKLPELHSAAPGYCLLVFGPEASTRVWLVRDGDALYVDRNGNGDLTEPGERVAAAESSKPERGAFVFEGGSIFDRGREHKALRVTWLNVDHLIDLDADIKRAVERDPQFRGCVLSLDVAMEGQHGTGLEGRVTQTASINDVAGVLEFAPRLADAPIIHFDGPWQITLSGKTRLQAGRTQDLYLVMGTPGVGAGTTACVAFEGVIPRPLKPRLELHAAAANGNSVTHTYDLGQRCCGFNLYDGVRTPEDAAAGQARLSITLENWFGATVTATTHEIEILAAPPGPKREPVSARLSGRLKHSATDGAITNIQFSPDGKRLIAGDYPGGTIHVWDVASRNRLLTIEAAKGYRGSAEYFAVTPDWKTLIVPTINRGKFEKFERDGKSWMRVTYDNSIQTFDLETGVLQNTWTDDPPRLTRTIKLLPDGKRFLAQQELPGEFETRRPHAISLWNIATGERHDVGQGARFVNAFSPDSQLAAVSIPTATDEFHSAIGIVNVDNWTQRQAIALAPLQRCFTAMFLHDNQLLAGLRMTNSTPNDLQNVACTLAFWKVSSGEETFSVPAETGEIFMWLKPLPDGPGLLATTFNSKAGSGRLLLIDPDKQEVKELLRSSSTLPREPELHPKGKWVVVPVQAAPKPTARDVPPTELPQPRLHVYELASGKLLEEIVEPHAYAISTTFSPDGNTLASSGQGEVLLWDFSTPPGQPLPNKSGPVAKIGDAFEAAGTLAGGKPLDWNAYQDKVVLVSFWATWCKPCVAELPIHRALYEKYHDRGFEILAISLDDDPQQLNKFLAAQQIPWAVLCGESEERAGLRHPLALKHGIQTVPVTYLVARDGKIKAIDPQGEELTKAIEELLAK